MFGPAAARSWLFSSLPMMLDAPANPRSSLRPGRTRPGWTNSLPGIRASLGLRSLLAGHGQGYPSPDACPCLWMPGMLVLVAHRTPSVGSLIRRGLPKMLAQLDEALRAAEAEPRPIQLICAGFAGEDRSRQKRKSSSDT